MRTLGIDLSADPGKTGEMERWPPMAYPPPADRAPLRFRRTDIILQDPGSRPLSVSSDRIGVAAMRGARIQALMAAEGIPVDRSGTTGRVIEAYPAAALRAWRLSSTGYKGRPNAEARRRLVDSVTERCGHLSPAVAACLDGCDDDALDAFVCAVIARASLFGLTRPPSAEDLAVACREGWIHVPTADLLDIVSLV